MNRMGYPYVPETNDSWSWSKFSSWFPQSLGAAFLVSFLSNSYVFNSVKLLVLGSMIETGRRLCQWLLERFRIQYSMTAQFNEGDPAYEWIVHFLNEQQVWRRSCEFHVSAKSSSRKWGVNSELNQSTKLGSADYVPTYELPQLFRWNGYWLETKRSKSMVGSMSSPFGHSHHTGMIFVTIYTLNMSVLSALVEEARLRYIEVSRPDVIIHMADTPNYNPAFAWTNVKCKLRRPLSSIILQEGVLESLLQDAREFLATENWYIARGIPHRRGYLLHGPPGSGKSSTIYALAGELGMEIYSLSLASGFVDDSFLQRAASSIPKNSIFLIEDIDCAFSSREDGDDEHANLMAGLNGIIGASYMQSPIRRSVVTLSTLLNVIDGVGSEEGKLFFATTNYMDRLDPALLRPGRIDKKIQYSLSTKEQAAALFVHFFPESSFTPSTSADPGMKADDKISDSNTDMTRTDTAAALSNPTDTELSSNSTGESESSNLSHVQHIAALSKRFAERVPPNEFSTAELQGYLLGCKKQPEQAVAGVTAWVEEERTHRREMLEREAAITRKAKEKRESMARLSASTPPPPPSPTVTTTSSALLVENEDQPSSPSPAYEASEGPPVNHATGRTEGADEAGES